MTVAGKGLKGFWPVTAGPGLTTWLSMLAAMVLSLSTGKAMQGLREYCEWESFNATCAHDEVLLMRSAKYGRMKLGRCVTKNYGHIGCGTDVMPYFEGLCSGRQHCVVGVISLHNKRSCPKDFKAYLEASYRCLKVTRTEPHACRQRGRQLVKGQSGYISSWMGEQGGVGSQNCPWVIQVSPHQRLNITLVDFSQEAISGHGHGTFTGERSKANSFRCLHHYASIYERNRTRNVTICGGRLREVNVYMSETNSVEIRMIGLENAQPRPPFFLLRFQAVGCAPIPAPYNAWVQSDSDHAIVRCNETDEAWFLTCRGTQWIGQVGNCSAVAVLEEEWTLGNMFEGVTSFPFGNIGLLIVVALGVAIGVAIGLVMLVSVLAYMKRRRRRRVRSRSNYLLKNLSPEGRDGSSKDNTTDCSPMLCKRDSICSRRDHGLRGCSDYATWQGKRPLPVPATVALPDGHCADPAHCTDPTHHDVIIQQTNHAGGTLPRAFKTFKPVGTHESCYGSPTAQRNDYVLKECMGEVPIYFKLDSGGREPLTTRDPESPDGHKPDIVPGCMECQERPHVQHSMV